MTGVLAERKRQGGSATKTGGVGGMHLSATGDAEGPCFPSAVPPRPTWRPYLPGEGVEATFRRPPLPDMCSFRFRRIWKRDQSVWLTAGDPRGNMLRGLLQRWTHRPELKHGVCLSAACSYVSRETDIKTLRCGRTEGGGVALWRRCSGRLKLAHALRDARLRVRGGGRCFANFAGAIGVE